MFAAVAFAVAKKRATNPTPRPAPTPGFFARAWAAVKDLYTFDDPYAWITAGRTT